MIKILIVLLAVVLISLWGVYLCRDLKDFWTNIESQDRRKMIIKSLVQSVVGIVVGFTMLAAFVAIL